MVSVQVFITSYGTSYYLVIFIAIFAFLAILLQNYQIKVFRESTRLDNVSSSPITTFFLETLNGLPVIRSYNKISFVWNHYQNSLSKNMQNVVTKYAIQNFYNLYQNILTSIIQVPAIIMIFYSNSSIGVVGVAFYIVIDLVTSFSFFSFFLTFHFSFFFISLGNSTIF